MEIDGWVVSPDVDGKGFIFVVIWSFRYYYVDRGGWSSSWRGCHHLSGNVNISILLASVALHSERALGHAWESPYSYVFRSNGLPTPIGEWRGMSPSWVDWVHLMSFVCGEFWVETWSTVNGLLLCVFALLSITIATESQIDSPRLLKFQ